MTWRLMNNLLILTFICFQLIMSIESTCRGSMCGGSKTDPPPCLASSLQHNTIPKPRPLLQHIRRSLHLMASPLIIRHGHAALMSCPVLALRVNGYTRTKWSWFSEAASSLRLSRWLHLLSFLSPTSEIRDKTEGGRGAGRTGDQEKEYHRCLYVHLLSVKTAGMTV